MENLTYRGAPSIRDFFFNVKFLCQISMAICSVAFPRQKKIINFSNVRFEKYFLSLILYSIILSNGLNFEIKILHLSLTNL